MMGSGFGPMCDQIDFDCHSWHVSDMWTRSGDWVEIVKWDAGGSQVAEIVLPGVVATRIAEAILQSDEQSSGAPTYD
jgi:hypothetical protein